MPPLISPTVSSLGGSAAAFFPPHSKYEHYRNSLVGSTSEAEGWTSMPPASETFNNLQKDHDDDGPVTELVDHCARRAALHVKRHKDNLYGAFDAYNATDTRRRGALYCRSGSWLEILDDSVAISVPEHKSHPSRNVTVHGNRKANSKFAVLEFLSVAFGLIAIRGAETQRFLCMNNNGELYSSKKYSLECIFLEEMFENFYNLYSSCAYGNHRKKWYVALRKDGVPRYGAHTKPRRKGSHFLVVHYEPPTPFMKKTLEGFDIVLGSSVVTHYERSPSHPRANAENTGKKYIFVPFELHYSKDKKSENMDKLSVISPKARVVSMDKIPPEEKNALLRDIALREREQEHLRRRIQEKLRRRKQRKEKLKNRPRAMTRAERLNEEEKRREERREEIRRLRNEELRWKNPRLSGAGLKIQLQYPLTTLAPRKMRSAEPGDTSDSTHEDADRL